MHYLLMAQTAITTVAVFEMVGSILVIAMLIVPPATALLISKRLHTMILLSVVFAIVSAAGGHIAAITVPPLFGFSDTVTAGGIATVAGLLFATVAIICRLTDRSGTRRGRTRTPQPAIEVPYPDIAPAL